MFRSKIGLGRHRYSTVVSRPTSCRTRRYPAFSPSPATLPDTMTWILKSRKSYIVNSQGYDAPDLRITNFRCLLSSTRLQQSHCKGARLALRVTYMPFMLRDSISSRSHCRLNLTKFPANIFLLALGIQKYSQRRLVAMTMLHGSCWRG